MSKDCYFRTAGEYKVRKVSTKYESEAKDNVRDEDIEIEDDNDNDEDDDSSLEIRIQKWVRWKLWWYDLHPAQWTSKLEDQWELMSFSIFLNPQSDPTSASTLQLDELEDLEDEVIQTEADHQVIKMSSESDQKPNTRWNQ